MKIEDLKATISRLRRVAAGEDITVVYPPDANDDTKYGPSHSQLNRMENDREAWAAATFDLRPITEEFIRELDVFQEGTDGWYVEAAFRDGSLCVEWDSDLGLIVAGLSRESTRGQLILLLVSLGVL